MGTSALGDFISVANVYPSKQHSMVCNRCSTDHCYIVIAQDKKFKNRRRKCTELGENITISENLMSTNYPRIFVMKSESIKTKASIYSNHKYLIIRTTEMPVHRSTGAIIL